MKTTVRLLILLGLIQFTSCSVLEQAQEVQRFIQCDFKLDNIQVLEFGGVKISEVKNIDEIGFLTMMSLGNQIMNGSLPARISIGLKATNSNPATASIAGMGWKILMKEQDFLGGEINNSVVVQPNSSTVFPVAIDLDLYKLMESESLPAMLNFVFAENKAEELKKMGVGIKIKPYYRVGGEIQKYPGYLNINL